MSQCGTHNSDGVLQRTMGEARRTMDDARRTMGEKRSARGVLQGTWRVL